MHTSPSFSKSKKRLLYPLLPISLVGWESKGTPCDMPTSKSTWVLSFRIFYIISTIFRSKCMYTSTASMCYILQKIKKTLGYVSGARSRKCYFNMKCLTFSRTKRGRAMEARLHTAVSSGLENSTISVHKLEDLIVPRFCWLLFLLHASWDRHTQSIRSHKCSQIPNNKVFSFCITWLLPLQITRWA